MKKWTSFSGYTTLLPAPGATGTKLCDINPNSVVEATGETQEINGVTYERVTYHANNTFDGWVERRKVEPYNENFPRDCVDIKAIQTPDPRDAEQYVLWKGAKQVNMCGELSVCYLLKISLAQMLDKWETAAPSFWKSVFGQGMARTTGEDDLVRMFSIFDVKAEALASKYKSYTPGLLTDLIGAIVSVKISPTTGRLNGGGVGHWVVVTDVLSERIGYGLVYIYNPFPNRIEVYSYAEFLASARVPYGVMMTK